MNDDEITDEQAAEMRERIAQAVAAESGCTIEQARARGWLLGLSLSGPIEPERKARLMREADWA